MRKLVVLALAALAASACDEGTGVSGARVGVELSVPAAAASMSASSLAFGAPVAASIDVSGDNGVLTLDTVQVILAEFELERVGELEGCDSMGMEETSCEEFEGPPSLQDLPVDGGSVTAVSAEVPVGEYRGVSFEIEDLEDDESDPVMVQQIQDLRDSILAEFGEWPLQASMRVVGSFTPTGGDPIPFVTFIEAEIEMELGFDTPFVVTEADVSRTVTVELSPSDWFLRNDGTVINLADYDYATTGQVPAFEAEMEHGFTGVEHDD